MQPNSSPQPMILNYRHDGSDGPVYNTPTDTYRVHFYQKVGSDNWDAMVLKGANNMTNYPPGILKKPWQLMTVETPPLTSKYYAAFSKFLHQTGFVL
jgi:hypothetical protein